MVGNAGVKIVGLIGAPQKTALSFCKENLSIRVEKRD